MPDAKAGENKMAAHGLVCLWVMLWKAGPTHLICRFPRHSDQTDLRSANVQVVIFSTLARLRLVSQQASPSTPTT